MLVLTRKLGEEIVIGENVRVTVVRIDGNKVRVGIAAHASVPVRRQEVCANPPSERARFIGAASTSEAKLAPQMR
jgi:carbon storage regulator